jgi:protein-tyrosine phosphatase
MNTRISRILILVLAIGAAASVVAQQAHARRVPLEGALNFRDLGGYPTADGKQVKWGLVYRSNHLANLTVTDYQTLNKLGIKLVCDLRTDGERKRSPTMWQGDARPEIMTASVLRETDVVLTPDRLKEIASVRSNALNDTYARMVTETPEQYGHVLRRLANGSLPAVAHCTAGKDRTGVFSAVLLTILRVPREHVVRDYMLTGEYMLSEQGLRAAATDWQKLTGDSAPPDPSLLRSIYTMHAEAIIGTFAAIDRKYGSFDTFVRDGLKLSDADVASLRRRLLEDRQH